VLIGRRPEHVVRSEWSAQALSDRQRTRAQCGKRVSPINVLRSLAALLRELVLDPIKEVA
jgi:hypothetical protein